MQGYLGLSRRALLVFIWVQSILLSERFLEALLVLIGRAGTVAMMRARHRRTSNTSPEKTRHSRPLI
jgi:hypothetical protein